jgi:sortase A
MGKYYYTKGNKTYKRKTLRLIALGMLLTGLGIMVYVFFPLLSWQVYFAPVFSGQSITAPIPQNTIVSGSTIGSLIEEVTNNLSGIDYTNAQNWFPNLKIQKSGKPKIQNYTLSIPKLKITNAMVSTIDNDLARHLVNYGGTSIPADKGNAVIFGHSTLPQLYDSKNYKTVFTFLYELTPGDEIDANIENVTYKYKVENITVVDPDNTSVLQQNYNDSYLTLVTCTPPGTIWKRLVIKAKLQNI